MQIKKTNFIFHHVHKLNLKKATTNNSRCMCQACQILSPVVGKMRKIFILGLIFPPLYFYIWAIKIYAIIRYRQQILAIAQLSKGSEEEQIVSEDHPLSGINEQSSTNNLGSGLANPFSDANRINDWELQKDVNRQRLVNRRSFYDFKLHAKTNAQFDRWLGRSFIAFTGQILIIFLIVLSVILEHKRK
ncbi:uncharacterized protein C5L36_0B10195 [Pichia kudriavzevii]|uniref:Uncharacterized protein n=1 Tax=Pichia kudriavzevii TaxID=4909 RepID=A0A2U9R3D0_PICKU|nr:uncharacterized protein C5L36_0B10195 [Pichia kudriavzevii]AWU75783.1 hypothetical protein C5L36_0B10195 [Pichia kudriavzevii]